VILNLPSLSDWLLSTRRGSKRKQLPFLTLPLAYLDDKKDGFSHPVEDIPLVQRLLHFHQTGLARPLKLQLFHFFERVNELTLGESNTLQDASIVDFILALAAITEVNQRSKKHLHPFSAMIEECILSEFMPGFERKLTESNRIDFRNLISILRELWDSRRGET
jgi:hypothetical protein